MINAPDESKVLCSICEALVSRGGKDAMSYNTTNLRKYLKAKHQFRVSVLILIMRSVLYISA